MPGGTICDKNFMIEHKAEKMSENDFNKIFDEIANRNLVEFNPELLNAGGEMEVDPEWDDFVE